MSLKIFHADVPSKSRNCSTKQRLALTSSYFDVIGSGITIFEVKYQMVCYFLLIFLRVLSLSRSLGSSVSG